MNIKPIPGDPFPYGVLVFAIMPKASTEETKDRVIKLITADLDAFERKLGGNGLTVEMKQWNDVSGKLEWIVDPKKKVPHAESVERMAKVAIELRKLELKMASKLN